MTEGKGSKAKTLNVNLGFPGLKEGEQLPPMRVYLFDFAGQLVSSIPAGKKPLTFEISADRDHRVLLGPDMPEPSPGEPSRDLQRTLVAAGAVTLDHRASSASDRVEFTVTPGSFHRRWNCVTVRGRVRKLLNPSGGLPQYAPICGALVRIFSIDLACALDRLGDDEVRLLRDKLVEQLVGRSGHLLDIARTLAGRDEVAVIKEVIVAEDVWLSKFLCALIPDPPWSWTALLRDPCWRIQGEAQIQSDGTFHATVCGFFPPWPNLYFNVRQTIDGVEQFVYHPQVSCGTYYRFDGTTPVEIIVDDPRAVACAPPPRPGPDSPYVWPYAIGVRELSEIEGLLTGTTGPLTGTTGLLPGNTPFGGTLRLKMQFGHLWENNIRYYRWSYKFDGDPSFIPITATVTHLYVTPPGTTPVTLGPQNVGTTPNLFAIPDPDREQYHMVIYDWIDIPFAHFDSTAGTTPGRSGMCTLRLEMFDAGGNFVLCNNPPSPGVRFTFRLTDPSSPPGRPASMVAPPPNIDAEGRLVFRIRVDNNRTVAELGPVRTASGGTDCCGFLHYSGLGDGVQIVYRAHHLNDFLDWSLRVTRGSDRAASARAVAGDPAPAPPPLLPLPAEGYAPTNMSSPRPPADPPADQATFTNLAGTLLSGCPHRAAFAVRLDCTARATDGYRQQSQYNSSQLLPFALTDEPAVPTMPCGD